MALDLYRTDSDVVAVIDLPGVQPDSIEVDVDRQHLTVRAERTTPSVEGARWMARGRARGTFAHRFTLADGLDTERIAADYTNGVLTLTVPVAEQALPRRVAVTTGAVTASSTVQEPSTTESADDVVQAA